MDSYSLDQLVPLSHLVIEQLADSVSKLSKKLGDGVFLDDLGRECCTREQARALFAERAAKQAAQREAFRRKAAEQKAAREARRAAAQAERAREAQRPAPPRGNWRPDYDPEHGW
ncbi:hypothetical protein ABVK33_10050 [Mycobacterium kansasii]|uniref:hypothetical protein n=1 Tax=Mycobacterium kansasii TaxID=1768 RepID=UPI000F03E38E|nr:hypothetical protein [Mycobacterium kansasii]VAZ65317.1 hypothetical protein LAUMK40_01442 [Mycobacterium kansasii]